MKIREGYFQTKTVPKHQIISNKISELQFIHRILTLSVLISGRTLTPRRRAAVNQRESVVPDWSTPEIYDR